MKLFIISFVFLGLNGIATVGNAEESVGEKVSAAGKNTGRTLTKGAHRVEEGICGKLTGDSKVSCLAKKMKNRATETKDAVVDKASEVKNTVD